MGQRQDLHKILVDIIGDSSRVYFQPPDGTMMKFPCIIYNLDYKTYLFADNNPYKVFNRYSVQVVDVTPDSDISEKISKLPMCSFDRQDTSSYLTYYVYSIYF